MLAAGVVTPRPPPNHEHNSPPQRVHDAMDVLETAHRRPRSRWYSCNEGGGESPRDRVAAGGGLPGTQGRRRRSPTTRCEMTVAVRGPPEDARRSPPRKLAELAGRAWGSRSPSATETGAGGPRATAHEGPEPRTARARMELQQRQYRPPFRQHEFDTNTALAPRAGRAPSEPRLARGQGRRAVEGSQGVPSLLPTRAKADRASGAWEPPPQRRKYGPKRKE